MNDLQILILQLSIAALAGASFYVIGLWLYIKYENWRWGRRMFG